MVPTHVVAVNVFQPSLGLSKMSPTVQLLTQLILSNSSTLLVFVAPLHLVLLLSLHFFLCLSSLAGAFSSIVSAFYGKPR